MTSRHEGGDPPYIRSIAYPSPGGFDRWREKTTSFLSAAPEGEASRQAVRRCWLSSIDRDASFTDDRPSKLFLVRTPHSTLWPITGPATLRSTGLSASAGWVSETVALVGSGS